MATLPTYVSREAFMAATDTKTTANLSSSVDRILASASRQVDQSLHRTFYPYTRAVTFRPRDDQRGTDAEGSYVWLPDDLLTVTSVVADGTTLVGSTYSLDSQVQGGDGYLKLRSETIGAEMVITGVWGFSNQTVPAGALAEALDASETGVDVTDSSLVGIGDLLVCESERMVVTDKSLLTTTTTLNDTLAASDADTLVTVADGTKVKQGEVLTFDSERMKVISISTHDLTVIRAYDGSTLAAHTTGITVYAPRTLTVERGATGSTAAAHDTATALTRHTPPSPITALTMAEAMTQYQQESSAYALVVGSGEGQREASGKGLADVRMTAAPYRRNRFATV